VNGNLWDAGGHLAADFIKEFLEVDVLLGYRGDGEVKGCGTGEAGLFAYEPFDGGLHGDFGWKGLALGWGELDEENGFLFVPVGDERWDEDFFRKGKLEFACCPACGKFPCDGGWETGVPWVGPVDVPSGGGTETKSESGGFSRLNVDRFCKKIDGNLRGFGDRTGPERGLEEKEAGEPP